MNRKTTHAINRLLPRQQLLISLLGSFPQPLSRRHFQKLLFLYCQEFDGPSPYEFVPYRFGAFSFTSYADLRKLTDRGLLVDEKGKWKLTRTGRRATLGLRHAAMASFVDSIGILQEDTLVEQTYRQFPYYATRSEIARSVLRGDKTALSRIDAARPETTPSTLLTIGYEARSLECYLNLLLQAGVTLLCDVRRNAVSRKYGFAKSTLSNACEWLGIRYEHLPELGISSERRRRLKAKSDYHQLFTEYEKHDLPRQLEALATTVRWIRSGKCVALTCYEQDAKDCHRSRVAVEIDRQVCMSVPVRHL